MSYGDRRKFYTSKLWTKVKNTIWLKQHCLCAICGRPVYIAGINEDLPKEKRVTGIVHHIEELNNTNVYDPNVSLNEDNLVGVCKNCHEELHHEDISTRKGYRFDENGNLIRLP